MRSDLLIRGQISGDIGHILGAQAQLLAGHHQGAGHLGLATRDAVLGNELGEAAGRSDDDRVVIGLEASVDAATGLQFKGDAFITQGDVRRGVDDGTDEGLAALAGSPTLELRTVGRTVAVELVAHDAALGEAELETAVMRVSYSNYSYVSCYHYLLVNVCVTSSLRPRHSLISMESTFVMDRSIAWHLLYTLYSVRHSNRVVLPRYRMYSL